MTVHPPAPGVGDVPHLGRRSVCPHEVPALLDRAVGQTIPGEGGHQEFGELGEGVAHRVGATADLL